MYSLSFIFLALLGMAFAYTVRNPIIEPRTPKAFDYEQEIANLNATRISKLPAGTVYTFKYSHTTAGSNRPAAADGLVTLDRTASVTMGSVVCETTDGSPRTYDVIRAIAALNLVVDKNNSALCCQRSAFGSMCTLLAGKDSASLGICGSWNFCTYCRNAVDMYLAIVDQCMWTDKVGGSLDFGVESNKLIIYHS